jgi:hypothetical protein
MKPIFALGLLVKKERLVQRRRLAVDRDRRRACSTSR